MNIRQILLSFALLLALFLAACSSQGVNNEGTKVGNDMATETTSETMGEKMMT